MPAPIFRDGLFLLSLRFMHGGESRLYPAADRGSISGLRSFSRFEKLFACVKFS